MKSYTNDQLTAKCDRYSVTAIKLLLLMTRLEGIPLLLREILDNLKGQEELRIEEWTGSKWYIEVVDHSIQYSPGNSAVVIRCWFTVDINQDSLMDNQHEGNCGYRSLRWERFYKRWFPSLVAGKDYHKYNHKNT